MPDKTAWHGHAGLRTATDDFTTMEFIIKQAIAGVATSTVVKIVAVTNNGGVEPVGFVDVVPLVAQVDGVGNTTPHGTIYHIPYSRMQGGTNAVIMDPKVGDLGIAVFASRDISAVKENKTASPPGSKRKHDMSDGMYVGGLLNGTPTQLVRFTDDFIEILSPTEVKIKAPKITFDGDLTVTGGITAGYGGGDQVTLQHHKHGTGNAAAGTVVPTAGT